MKHPSWPGGGSQRSVSSPRLGGSPKDVRKVFSTDGSTTADEVDEELESSLDEDEEVGEELLHSCEVPGYQQVPFILSGYRRTQQDLGGFLRTVFTLHNQTGNIWTHLLGFFYFLAVGMELATDIAVSEYEGLSRFEPMTVLLLAASSAFCLLASFCYHVYSCSDRCTYECVYKMDLSGIVLLVGMSYFTGVVLAYRCHTTLRNFYLCYAAVITALLTLPLVRPEATSNMTRHMILCVAAGIVPAAHWFCITTVEDAEALTPYVVLMFFFYGSGAAFYVTRWPESHWPGKFDLLGHSHQVWHIFVVLAAVSWVRGCSYFLKYSDGPHCEEERGDAALVPWPLSNTLSQFLKGS